jgi:hypothetical protein
MSLCFDIPKESKFKADGIAFDSQEEVEFYHWCKEAQEHGYITDFVYHPEPFVLAKRASYKREEKLIRKTKIVDVFLLNPHEYTPDFIIVPTAKFSELEHGLRESEDQTNYLFRRPQKAPKIFIDVKGDYDIHHSNREFSINQKWMYEKYKIFVNKVVPEKFFARTWVPAAATVSPKKKVFRKKYAGFRRVSGTNKLQF